MREKFFICFRVLVGKIYGAFLHVTLEVIISPVCKAIEFFSAKRIIEFKIYRTFRIMRALAVWYFKLMDSVGTQTDVLHPCIYFFPKIFKSILPIVRPYKIFNLHLFKLSCAKKKISRSNLI